MLQFQNKFVVVELLNNATAIYLSWRGTVPGKEYRTSLIRALEIAKAHKISNWISDISEMGPIMAEDQEWAGKVWIPEAVSSRTYQKQAVVVDEYFGGVSSNDFVVTVQGQEIEFKHFSSLEEAKHWLQEGKEKGNRNR